MFGHTQEGREFFGWLFFRRQESNGKRNRWVFITYKFINRREGDVISAYADTNKANTILGWKAELSLKDALLSAWKGENK